MKGYCGILDNLSRVVPGSGRPAALVRDDKESRSKSRKGVDQVTIVEDDEDEYRTTVTDEGYRDTKDEWTTVMKQKPKEKEAVVPEPKAKRTKKAKRSL
jgi:hypothetical protein